MVMKVPMFSTMPRINVLEKGKYMSGDVLMQKELRWRGCYSIKYQDPNDHDWTFAIDYDWRVDTAGKNRWKCSESPSNTIHWSPLRIFPDSAYTALLDHFGLEKNEIDFLDALAMSPSDLVRMRRIKEEHDGLEHKVIKNMRSGCLQNELFADTFEARP